MKPSLALETNREAIRALVAKYQAGNPRVFGSVARGDDTDDSDIDILVDAMPNANLFKLGGLQYDLQALLGVKVDLVTPEELSKRIKGAVMAEARAI